MAYSKVVVLNTVYNFVVEEFFYLKSFWVLNMCFKFIDLEIKILEFLKTLNVHIVNTKDIAIDQIYMFSIDKFLIWSF
jgi:hypothetical protein